MTPTAALLARIGWTTAELSRRLRIGYSRARCWETGENTRGNPVPTPPEVLAWLEQVADALEREGVPVL